MKKSLLFFLSVVVLISCSSNGDEAKKEEKFTVYGNCGMCEKKIEGSLDEVKGVSSADWDVKTDMMTGGCNPKIITLDEIKQKIADVGYDSDSHRAKDAVYDKLHGCCKYDRPK